MRIMDREKRLLEYLQNFKIATTDTIYELFYKPSSLQICQKRLLKLFESGNIKRCRDHFTYQYQYYLRKPKQLFHDLLLTSLHRELYKRVNIFKFEKEFSIGNIRSDGFIAYSKKDSGDNYIAFIEIHICNTSPDIDKYNKLYESGEWKKVFPTFPQLIVVSNRKVKESSNFKIIHLKEDLSDIEGSL